MNALEYQDFVNSVSSDDTSIYMSFKDRLEVLHRNHGCDPQRLITAALGMVGESQEYLDLVVNSIITDTHDKRLLELGDVLWYIIQACEGLGVGLDKVQELSVGVRNHYIEVSPIKLSSMETDELEPELASVIGEFCDLLKKILFHGKSFVENHKKLLDILAKLYYTYENELQWQGFTLEEVMLANVEKLSNRHKEGFTSNYDSDSGDSV
jgi:NTP pyrophosphatase (non-canonical NTP hydrolase)